MAERRSYSSLCSEKETTFNGENYTYLDLRKLFVPQIDRLLKKNNGVDLTGKSHNAGLLPLNSLNTVLIMLYSVDYIRKLLKKKYISNLYTTQHYNTNLFSKFLSELATTIFYMKKKDSNRNHVENFYQLLLKYEPSISSYYYKNLHVR